MQPTTLLTTLLPLLPLALSAPTAIPSTLAPRSCTTILPSSYQQISSTDPSNATGQSSRFSVSFDAAANNAAVDTVISFAGIPRDAFGCQLGISFTPGYPIENAGDSRVDVYALPNTFVESSDTYDTYFPQGGVGRPYGVEGSFLFGTTAVDGTRHIVNSESCTTGVGGTLAFLAEIASGTPQGEVAFTDAGDNLSGIGGFFLTYNC